MTDIAMPTCTCSGKLASGACPVHGRRPLALVLLLALGLPGCWFLDGTQQTANDCRIMCQPNVVVSYSQRVLNAAGGTEMSCVCDVKPRDGGAGR
jgi:hypothetical protein